jgi:hypothetical protein
MKDIKNENLRTKRPGTRTSERGSRNKTFKNKTPRNEELRTRTQ